MTRYQGRSLSSIQAALARLKENPGTTIYLMHAGHKPSPHIFEYLAKQGFGTLHEACFEMTNGGRITFCSVDDFCAKALPLDNVH